MGEDQTQKFCVSFGIMLAKFKKKEEQQLEEERQNLMTRMSTLAPGAEKGWV